MIGLLILLVISRSRITNFLLLLKQVIRPLKILNFKDSHSLVKIHYISRLPNLETLILWNCYSLVRVSEAIEDLKCLSLLNVTGCEQLFKVSNFGQQQPVNFSFPHMIQSLLLKNCSIEPNNHFLNFKHHSLLQYLNLSNNLFDLLPDYNHLKNLRVLDLSFCSRLKCIECLPSTLEELFITCCKSLEKIAFQSPQFTLREIDYQGCTNLLEIEGLFKLEPIMKVDEIFLGHMKWLKEYQNLEVCLIGDYHLTAGRNRHIQVHFCSQNTCTSTLIWGCQWVTFGLSA